MLMVMVMNKMAMMHAKGAEQAKILGGADEKPESFKRI